MYRWTLTGTLVVGVAAAVALANHAGSHTAVRTAIFVAFGLLAINLLYRFYSYRPQFVVLTNATVLFTAGRSLECVAYRSIVDVDATQRCCSTGSLFLTTRTDERFQINALCQSAELADRIQRATILAIPLKSPAKRGLISVYVAVHSVLRVSVG